MSGIVIAGTHSGCGKTTVTLGLLAVLKKMGLSVQSFKAGPDFIDAGLHRMITGRPSRNLDLWMCGEDYVRACFLRYSSDVEISIVEGAMGLYDGDFSTARLAEVLGLPVILVVDAYGMAESAGAVVKGFVEYGAEVQNRGSREVSTSGLPDLRTSGRIAGVIFNRVASERHFHRLRDCVRDVKVFGYVPRDLNFQIPHRHLGLTVAEENPLSEENIERLAGAVLRHVNIEGIIKTQCIEGEQKRRSIAGYQEHSKTLSNCPSVSLLPYCTGVKIAIAYDRAFCFYYEDNLDLLKEAGAEIVVFSPLSDTRLPEAVDAIYIGGGYPELYAMELGRNQSMLDAIHNWADSGMPMYAECGGLMYLSRGIYDLDGNFFKMAGVFPFETVMKKGMSRLGYREVLLNDDCILGHKGDNIKGHEFHYSEIKESSDVERFRNVDGLSTAYLLRNNTGERLVDEGYKYKNTLASYVHLHFGSNPCVVRSFINFIKEKKWKT